MPFLGAHSADRPETRFRNSVIRISVAGDIEKVEKVGTEAQNVSLTPQVEVFEERCVNTTISRRTFGAVVRRTEREGPGSAIGTGAIVDSGRDYRWKAGSGGRIRSPPITKSTIPDDQGTVLIGATEAPSPVVGIAIVGAEDGDRKSRIEDG